MKRIIVIESIFGTVSPRGTNILLLGNNILLLLQFNIINITNINFLNKSILFLCFIKQIFTNICNFRKEKHSYYKINHDINT